MVRRCILIHCTLIIAGYSAGCAPSTPVNPDDNTNCPTNGFPNPPCPPADALDLNTNSFSFGAATVIAPDLPAAFLMSLEGGLDAVDLSTGALLWHSAAAAKPLLVRGRFVAAQTELAQPLRTVLLDIDSNGHVMLIADSELPADVGASVVDGLGTSFQTTASINQEKLFVSWTYIERYTGGVDPGTNGLDRTVTGAVRIDLTTGAVDSTGVESVPTPDEPSLPDNVRALVDSGAITGPLWRTEGVLANLAPSDDGENTILRRWRADSGEPLADVTLFGADLTFRSVSADERHILASKSDDSGSQLWLWSIFSLATGERVGEVQLPAAGASFFVLGRSLYFESPASERFEGGQTILEPIKLHAVSLDTGVQLWEHARRDTAYRGSFPPGMP